jgi:mannose PTS system EIIA component
MVNLVIVSHGNLGQGLLDAMRLIAGEQEGVVAVSLTEADSIDELPIRITKVVDEIDQGDGVLMMVDLIGASPFNVTARLAMEDPRIKVVTGVNLPMLLETALGREGHTLEELVQLAQESGANGVRTLEQLLDQAG